MCLQTMEDSEAVSGLVGKEYSDGWATPRERQSKKMALRSDCCMTGQAPLLTEGFVPHTNPQAPQLRQLQCPHGWTFGWLTNSRRYTYSSSAATDLPYYLSWVKPALPQRPPGAPSQVDAGLRNTGRGTKLQGHA